MIKSTTLSILSILSILVFSSALPQSAQNQTLQTVDENRDLELTTNSPASRNDDMIVQLFRVGSGLSNPLAVGRAPSQPLGTFNIKSNRCYASPEFVAVKMDGRNINKGAFLLCRDANCGGTCYVHDMRLGNSINGVWYALGRRSAVSYIWTTS
ncbi:hypothetical protein AX774_g7604 [Zancudomyces culisetae]|uniref:Uncharacterized protein n=1 Tax=Zancudomyces culisetae TaxID=1213189 RepID=A0A1R1PDL1_ZANCU|nr:hypothetical protein AX774_g7604 [Zancudomyces culisetae]|eukprot:OMH78993.1 hypothetical protein AX774_g7604 [Zancudomyces culisetae]